MKVGGWVKKLWGKWKMVKGDGVMGVIWSGEGKDKEGEG